MTSATNGFKEYRIYNQTWFTTALKKITNHLVQSTKKSKYLIYNNVAFKSEDTIPSPIKCIKHDPNGRPTSKVSTSKQ